MSFDENLHKRGPGGERHEDRCGEEPANGDEPQRAEVTPGAGTPGASPSNTPPETSQEGTAPSAAPSVSIDWLECGGIIDVSNFDERQLFRMDQLMHDAPDQNRPIPFTLAGRSVLLYPRGMGSGTQARMTYRIEYCGAMLAFSNREAKDRGSHNFYYKIPGTACLIWGAWELRKIFHQMIESLGYQVVDEWPRRIDVCLDLPGDDWREELKPAIDAGCFVGTFSNQADYKVLRVSTGVTLSTGQIKLRIYDKLQDTLRQTPEYQAAMVQNRWGGRWPKAATRVELQISGEWLRQHAELKDLDGVMKHLPDIMEKLIGEGSRPFVRLTATPVDRENNHQSRAETHHVWSQHRDYWREGLGNPTRPPERLPRGMIDGKRAFANVKGYITADAARRGQAIESLTDALDQLGKMHDLNWATDEDWKQTWEEKARKFATLDSTTEFPTDDGPTEGGAACSE